MYDAYARASQIATTAGTVLLVCAAALAIESFATDFFFPVTPHVRLHVLPAQTPSATDKRPQQLEVVDAHLGLERFGTERVAHRAYTKFDIDGDFTMCFSWNTKLIYVAAVATYKTPKYPRNEVVIWDDLIGRKAVAKFAHLGVLEYPLEDIEQGLRGVNVTVKVVYQTMMYSGYAPLREVEGSAVSFTLSDETVKRMIPHGGL